MKHSFFALTLLAAVSFAAEPNTLTDEEKAAGWKLIFDGKTSAGWVGIGKTAFPASGWSVEDGALKFTKGGGDIVTGEQFENFDLTWDWKIATGGNSGLKYNLPDPKKGVGFEYQLMDDANHPDGKRGGGTRVTASLYDLIAPAADRTLKATGEWNTSRILVSGNHAEHWLNGAKTVEFEFGGDALKAAIAKSKYKSIPKFGDKTKSPILLQDHGDEIAFRSMKLRVLPAK